MLTAFLQQQGRTVRLLQNISLSPTELKTLHTYVYNLRLKDVATLVYTVIMKALYILIHAIRKIFLAYAIYSVTVNNFYHHHVLKFIPCGHKTDRKQI